MLRTPQKLPKDYEDCACPAVLANWQGTQSAHARPTSRRKRNASRATPGTMSSSSETRMLAGSAMARAGRQLLNGGVAVFALGLAAGSSLLLHYFYVTPFEICSAVLATLGVSAAWPWAIPLLIAEAAALSVAGLGLALMA